MTNPFFEQPNLNSPYESPSRHWELDAQGQPTQKIIEERRRADFKAKIAAQFNQIIAGVNRANAQMET